MIVKYGIVSLHSSTGHFPSANTVLHSSLRMESEAKVPVGPPVSVDRSDLPSFFGHLLEMQLSLIILRW